MLDRELLEILVCPQCKGDLEYRPVPENKPAATGETEHELVCHQCRLRYEIRDDIPIMLVDEAKPL